MNIKKFIKDNKEECIRIAYYAGGVVVGVICTSYITNKKIEVMEEENCWLQNIGRGLAVKCDEQEFIIKELSNE